MQLVGMLDSPYVRRVAVTLLMAGVAFEHRPISLFRHIDEFSRISPLLKAPTLIAGDGTALLESSVILEYLATSSPAIAALMPATLRSFHATGLALTVCEKAVQFHYERALRSPDQRSETWVARVVGQLKSGMQALDRQASASASGWIGGGPIGVADITMACAFGFTQGMLADIVEPEVYPSLAAFSARAEALPAFRAAPPIDGVTAPVD
jgi:glutathione S-transferase